MITYRKISTWIVPPNGSAIIFAINASKKSKVAGVDGLPAKLLFMARAVLQRSYFDSLVSSCESEIFSNEWKNGMIVEIPEKGICLEGHNRCNHVLRRVRISKKFGAQGGVCLSCILFFSRYRSYILP